jgi:hypothetical protein
MKKYYRIVLMTAMAVMITATSTAQSPDLFFRAAGTPVNPKVTMSWNRYYTNAGIADFCNRLAKAYPNLVTISSAGKSVQGRDMTYLTVTEKNGVPDTHKPGYYVGANVHSIEIQGTEMAMYLAWYLCEMHASSTFIRELLRDKVFYIFPTINPDGREHFMTLAATPRSGLAPRDDDRDGLFDEDGFDDLNGDGERSQMRKRNPNGEYKADPDDPRKMVRVAPGERANGISWARKDRLTMTTTAELMKTAQAVTMQTATGDTTGDPTSYSREPTSIHSPSPRARQ